MNDPFKPKEKNRFVYIGPVGFKKKNKKKTEYAAGKYCDCQLCDDAKVKSTSRAPTSNKKAGEKAFPALVFTKKKRQFGESSVTRRKGQLLKPAVMIGCQDKGVELLSLRLEGNISQQQQFISLRDQARCDQPVVRIADYRKGRIEVNSRIYEAGIAWSNTECNLSQIKTKKRPTQFKFGVCKQEPDGEVVFNVTQAAVTMQPIHTKQGSQGQPAPFKVVKPKKLIDMVSVGAQVCARSSCSGAASQLRC